MLRSRGFLIFLAGAALLFLLRGRIAVLLPQLPVNPRARTTNTQVLAKTLTPGRTATSTETGLASGAAIAMQSASTPTPRHIVAEAPVSAQGGGEASVQAEAEPAYTQYLVKTGDTLYNIAKRLQIDVKTLAKINQLGNLDQLQVGQILLVPAPVATPVTTPAPTAAANTRIYVVQAGDTLASIGRELKINVSEIQRLNNLSDPNDINIGQQLLVPAPVTAATGTVDTVDRSVDEQLAAATGQKQTTSTGQPSPTATPQPRPTKAPVIPPPTPAPTPTPTPDLLRARPYCRAGVEQVAVWGVHFCLPEGWAMQEQSTPERAMYLSTTTAGGEPVLYAIIRPNLIPNAPLNIAIRSAKGIAVQRLSAQISGGIADPATWSSPQATMVSQQQAQSTAAKTTYGLSGVPASVRVIVFNYQGHRWQLIMVAPTAQWQHYANGAFAQITRSLTVF